MGLIFWWMMPVWAVVIVVWLVKYWIKRRKHSAGQGAIPIAHTDRLTNTPEYRRILLQYKIAVWVALGLMTVGFVVGMLLTARPSAILSKPPIDRSRDIMLCLDVSGSVLKADSALLNFFGSFVESFPGQRFGLTVFNSSAVTILPLNDNYPLTSQILKKASTAFQEQKGTTFATLTNGTLAGFSNGTSLASDGLATCMQYLGKNTQRRSQSVILATDNEAFGKAIMSMTQSQTTAKKKAIHVYAIDPGVSDPALAKRHSELETLAAQTGGRYYLLKNVSIQTVVNDIARYESTYYSGASQPASSDFPEPFFYVAAVTIIVALGLMWRLEL